MSDFPAAHSMDTTWFAVDAEGHIGMFDSSEGGAVPKSNSQFMREYWTNRQEDLCLYELNDLFWQWSQENENHVVYLEMSAHEVLRKLDLDLPELNSNEPGTNLAPWRNEFDISRLDYSQSWEYVDRQWLLILAGDESETFKILNSHCFRTSDYTGYAIRFSGEPNILFLMRCPKATLQMLFTKNLVQYACSFRLYSKDLAILLGLFYYRHNYSSPFPYECDGQPLHPLKLDDLPENLQDILTWTWFDATKFSESRKIQPIEHMQCSTWGKSKGWVDTHGNEREEHPHDRQMK
ncbi:MAG: hypothetical protein SWY16_12670 [Cyanobacteriota bacterium]|nr:hypothetical protein [Cyanobacteriota bacterium]